jgi:hypothetical protein
VAWLKIWRQKYGLSAEDICKKLREKTGEDVDPLSVEAYLVSKGAVYPPFDPAEAGFIPPARPSEFTNAMERDIESALLSQLDSLGLGLFVDENGRNGQQYPADEFGRIDLLATDANENFVVIELKRDDVPRSTIGQIAGYIAFVRKNIAKPRGRSVVGWIVARPSSKVDDSVLEQSAEAVGVLVKWYEVKLTLL